MQCGGLHPKGHTELAQQGLEPVLVDHNWGGVRMVKMVGMWGCYEVVIFR